MKWLFDTTAVKACHNSSGNQTQYSWLSDRSPGKTVNAHIMLLTFSNYWWHLICGITEACLVTVVCLVMSVLLVWVLILMPCVYFPLTCSLTDTLMACLITHSKFFGLFKGTTFVYATKCVYVSTYDKRVAWDPFIYLYSLNFMYWSLENWHEAKKSWGTKTEFCFSLSPKVSFCGAVIPALLSLDAYLQKLRVTWTCDELMKTNVL